MTIHMLPVPNLLLHMLLILRSPAGLTPFGNSAKEMEHKEKAVILDGA